MRRDDQKPIRGCRVQLVEGQGLREKWIEDAAVYKTQVVRAGSGNDRASSTLVGELPVSTPGPVLTTSSAILRRAVLWRAATSSLHYFIRMRDMLQHGIMLLHYFSPILAS